MQNEMQNATALDRLPDDTLRHTVEHLALQAADSPTGVATALDAIGLVNKHFRAIADSALLWRLAARALGVQDSCCNDISIRDRVLGACHAEETLFAHGAIAHSRMLATVLPRSGGWVSALFARLETLGLGCTWKPDGECNEPLPAVPYVLVMCDAADPAVRPPVCSTDGRLLTYPCALARCDGPAAVGCNHCGKHAGATARRCVELCAQQLTLGGSARRVVFAAPSSGVRDAFQRAIVSEARSQARRAYA